MMGNQNFLAGPLSDASKPTALAGTVPSRRSINRGTDRRVYSQKRGRLSAMFARLRGRR